MEKETTRIEAFSDGVFAIAITLLVLDLKVPDFEGAITQNQLMNYLRVQWPSYTAFSVSFFSIFIMWVNHHKIFKQIYKRNTAIMFANGLLLFLATSMSYTTALLSRYFNSPASHLVTAIYSGLFVLINLSFNLLWHVASHDAQLLRPELTPMHIKAIRQSYLYALPVHSAAFILSFISPVAAIALCLLLWTFWAFYSKKLNLTNP